MITRDDLRNFRAIVGEQFVSTGESVLNLHVIVMDDPSDSRRWARVEEANYRILERALALEGTCTGEHGVGIGKRRFLPAEHGDSLELMKRIKQLIDPEGLFNPGKLFP